ncbi:EAL and HDOD domain-containing protein [Ideonella alba]|uniref:HDOD domain-containing protein n=1 Tax=Ideonella alba TaxID=2824118 RepID=A0A941BHS2_9BURK|nr:HDOD domain-containing protein [Ideonella alba]MBQ0933452.1 HDOD domain-containing protein [Ideonella alba]
MSAPVLDHLILAGSALFDARRQPSIARLTVHPLPGGPAPDPEALAALLAGTWPADAGPIALNLTSETWLRALLDWLERAGVQAHWLVELPAFMLADAATTDRLATLSSHGQGLVLKGRPLAPLAPEQLRSFKLAVIDVDEERRVPGEASPAVPARSLPFAQSGVHTPAEASAAFKRGATAVVGWPLGDPPVGGTQRRDFPGAVSTVAELMQRLDREEPVGRLDEVLRRDPALAFRLIRYINSPGFGLSVEITSFQHAIMVLGYQRLKRWLALLLTSTVDSPDLQPMMHLAVRRGLLMEELARLQGDETLRNEAFICGVFSLLDRMLVQPFTQLLSKLPVPERVALALLDGAGAHAPGLALAQAVEAGLPYDIEAAMESLLLTPGEYNEAVLKSLAAARQLQG